MLTRTTVTNDRYIALDTSWNVNDVEFRNYSGGSSQMPAMNRVVLWGDQKKDSLFRFGGSISHERYLQQTNNRYLWANQPASSRGWYESNPANPGVFGTVAYGVDSLSTFCDGVGLIAGGFGTRGTDPSFTGTETLSQTQIPGMLTYNASTAMWNNVSANALSPSGSRQGGQAVCSTSFETPLAVFIGGRNAPSLSTQRKMDLKYADMTNIHLYDVRNSKWFSQRTTGEAPPAMDSFCSIGVESALQFNLPTYDM